MPPARSSELLGYAPDARVLIVNAGDLGMHQGINQAIVDSIERGIASSCSLMAPCPWASHAMGLLRRRPRIPFGIHLTLVRDSVRDRWGPLAPRAKVPSLLDGTGALFTADRYARLLREHPVGLNEWAVHPGLGDERSRATDGGWRVRQTDHEFLTSPRAREIIEREGIVVADDRPLQRVWSRTAPTLPAPGRRCG